MRLEGPRVRVLMVLESGFPIRGGGGAESQVRTLALRLKQRGHQVTVLTPRVPQAPQRTVDRYEGIPVCRIAYPRIRGIGTLVLWLRTLLFLLRHGRRYDAWHVHIAHYLGALTCMTGAFVRRPVIVKISGWWELEKGVLAPSLSPLTRLAQRSLKRADFVQAISHRIEAELVRHGFPKNHIRYLPNAVDTARFAQHEPNADSAPLTGIYVGRLVEEKNLDVLLDAWARVFPSPAMARLLIVGTGDCEPALRAQVERLGLGTRVEFLGHRSDIETLLRDVDIGLLPSKIEGLSNTLLEFMASGLPVIASAVSGSEDIVVDRRNGWLFDVGDTDALATCLGEAASLGRERLGELGRQARADVAAIAGLDVVVDQLLALYRSGRPAAAAALQEP